MIDEWKNPLKDPLFFAELDHNNLYKPYEYHSDQGSTLLVFVYNFFFSNFLIVLQFFPQYSIVKIFFQKHAMTNYFKRYLSQHPQKRWKQQELVCVLISPIQSSMSFFFCRKWRLLYPSVESLSRDGVSISLFLTEGWKHH